MLADLINFIVLRTPVFYLIQSIWRDEAFSYFMAKPNIIRVIVNTAHDFNPPLYYILLHFWINLVGQSDEGLRLLSFLAHLGSIIFVFILAEKLFSKRFAWFVAVFTFLNPMLLYYAFEMRMYSFYALFTFASLYFFYTKNWKWYTITGVLGLYTHSFFPLIIVSLIAYLWVMKQLNKKSVFLVIKPLLFYLPWLPILAIQFIHSKNSWLFPVDLQLITAALGNLFTSYEGTPGGLWGWHAFLSVIILFFMLIPIKQKKKEFLLFIIPVFFPLATILGYSVLKRPLFVNRYMIFVTIFEIMAVSAGIWSVKNKLFQSVSIVFWLVIIVIINLNGSVFHKKTDFKTAFVKINELAAPADYIYTKTPIAFLESAYYFKKKSNVFVYNPMGIPIPDYIGVNVVFPDISRKTFPVSPAKTFLVMDDASYTLNINK